jgi:hypothetical protein
MKTLAFIADKIGTAALWCAYCGFEVSIIVGAAVYFLYHLIKSKVSKL